MYHEVPALKIKNKNIKIWRYFNFAKFVSLLSKKSLFFNSIDAFTDPFEGIYYPEDISLKELSKKHRSELEYWRNFFREKMRGYTFVNSWHINNYESFAMWKIYLGNEYGVAVQSTIKNLCNSFHSCKEEIRVGKVRYKDYSKYKIRKKGEFFMNFHRELCKRKFFQYESELRAFFEDFPAPIKPGIVEFGVKSNEGGRYVSVDLDVLIQKIYVSPNAPGWFFELVKDVMKKYNLNKKIYQSRLNTHPQEHFPGRYILKVAKKVKE